jgi:hypothetical protein
MTKTQLKNAEDNEKIDSKTTKRQECTQGRVKL